MANKNIKQLTEVTTLNDTDGFEVDTGSSSFYILWSSLKTLIAAFTGTLTNKTINLASNTLTGTKAEFNTALSDADFATLAGSETLTNKTLTTPTIGDLTNANHTHVGATSGGISAAYGARGDVRNYKLSVTVTSNNLTVAVKTLAGSDPSSSDPIRVRIGNTERTITGALSVTKNAGTNWCNSGGSELATLEVDYFVYLGYNATDGVVIGFSRIPYANQYSDFSATSTNEKYAAISTITNAASTDYYENVGRFAATLSAGAGYTWTVPTFTAINLIERPVFRTRTLTYAPVWTSSTAPAIGNGTIVGQYKVRGRTVECRQRTVAGSTTTFGSGTYSWSTPFTAMTFTNGSFPGFGSVFDNSTTTIYVGASTVNSAAATQNLFTHSATSAVTATVPVTLATSDILTTFVQFELA